MDPGGRRGRREDPRLRDLMLQYLRVRRLLDEELAPRRRRRGMPRPIIGSPLYPQEALRDLALFFYLMALVCLLSALVPPALGDPANPDVTPDRLLPDWYLLWAFGLLKVAPNVELFDVGIVSGKFLGIMLIVVTFVAVILVPWIDRTIAYVARGMFKYPVTFSEGRRAKRPMADPVMASLGAGAVTYVLLASVYSIHEVVETTYLWISDADLKTAFVMLPLAVGLATYASLRAARSREDYEWRLNLCHGCGRCDLVCPVRPVRREPRVNLVHMVHSETEDHVWTCLACDRCWAECPQDIVMSSHTLNMRARGVVAEPQRPPQNCRDLLAWQARRSATALPGPPLPEEGSGRGRVGYFGGCGAALSLTRVSHDFRTHREGALALMEAVGADVMELSHLCCGHDALWQGDVDTFSRLRERNSAIIRASGVGTVVTECAECYRTLSRDYELEGVTVLHLSQYLRARRLEFAREPYDHRAGGEDGVRGDAPTPLRVAYHDPCRLGRHMGVYDEPRELVRAVPGVELVELEESREEARCCGVAAMMNCDQASRALRVRRMEQVQRSGATVLVTTCPKCVAHMVCLLDEGGYQDLEVEDLAVFLASRLPPRVDDDEGTGGDRPRPPWPDGAEGPGPQTEGPDGDADGTIVAKVATSAGKGTKDGVGGRSKRKPKGKATGDARKGGRAKRGSRGRSKGGGGTR